MSKFSLRQAVVWLIVVVGCFLGSTLAEPTVVDFPRPVDPLDTAIGTDFLITGIEPPNGVKALLGFVLNGPDNSTKVNFNFTQRGEGLFRGNPFVGSIGVDAISPSLPNRNGIFPFGIRVQTDVPVSVLVFVFINTGNHFGNDSSTGCLAFPIRNLGKKYLVNTVSAFEGFSVVALNANTELKLIFHNGTVEHVMLVDPLSLLHLRGDNVVGTIVETANASNPIAVFAGRNCIGEASMPCNYLLQEMPPAETFGTEFVYVRPPSASSPDQPQYTLFRFMNVEADTTITVSHVDGSIHLGTPGSVVSKLYLGATAYIQSDKPIDIEVINSYRFFGNQTQVSLVSNTGFFTEAFFQALVQNILTLIARTEDISNNPEGLVLNGVAVNPTLFKPTINAEFSSATLIVPIGRINMIKSAYKFMGYAYTEGPGLVSGSAINRKLV